MIICYTVPEIWHVMDVIVIFHFGLFFALPLSPHSGHWGINPPLKTPPPLSCQAPPWINKLSKPPLDLFDLIQSITLLANSSGGTFCIKILRSILPNAFQRPIKIIPVIATGLEPTITWLRVWVQLQSARVQLHSLKLQISRLFRARISLTFRQL